MRSVRDVVATVAAMSLLLAACGEDADDQSGDTTAPTGGAVEDTAVSPDEVSPDDGGSRPQSTDAPPTTDAAGEDGEQSSIEPLSATVTTGDPVPVEGPAARFAEGVDGEHWLLPWRDGFLSLRIEVGPQASPSELPEELAELVPQEVWDLFPDGFPPTLAEAQQIISDAGLLGVMADLLADNEELSDAIYSGETPTEVAADFTTDGVDWESLPIALPVDAASIQQVVSTGEEIALFGGPMEDDTPPEHYVATANGSLEDWSVEVLAASPVDVPGGIFEVAGSDGSFAANDDRWIARSTSEVAVDIPAVLRLAGIEDPDRYGYVLRYSPEALIVHPPIFVAWEDIGLTPGEDFDLEFEEGEEGDVPEPDEVLELAGIDLGNTREFAGWVISEEGITIDLDPADIGNVGVDPVTVAWEDTDLTAEQAAALRDALDALPPDPYATAYQEAVESWSAEWGEEPTYTAADEDEPWSWVYAVESGFLQHAERLEFSADGVSWVPVDGAPSDHDVVGTMLVDDGTVVLMMGNAGTRTFLVSSDMQRWQEVLVDGLPREFWSTQGGLSSAELISGSDAPDAVWLMATTDGDTWIVDPLGSEDRSEEVSYSRAARNGSTVLVFGPDGWARYEMGG